ncbi:hypothetical protein HOY82DRAFT_613603 [Tuber indicum]|nr:hypothetical protein HOY82DRAFT_613603 [Tuber indicum]
MLSVSQKLHLVLTPKISELFSTKHEVANTVNNIHQMAAYLELRLLITVFAGSVVVVKIGILDRWKDPPNSAKGVRMITVTVDALVAKSLAFIRLAKLTPRFCNHGLVANTQEIAAIYRERQIKDGKLEEDLANMVGDLRMCIWEANYIDWLAMVIHRAKYSKFFSEPSKAIRLRAQHLGEIVSIRSGSGGTPDSEGQERDSLTGLFRRACAELNQSESAVTEAIMKCINKKPSRDANEILILEKTERWAGLSEKILRDTRHLKECIPTEFIPFQAYIREALREFTRARSKGCVPGWVNADGSSGLVQKESSENRPVLQTGKKTETGARLYGENKRDMKENKRVDVESGDLKKQWGHQSGFKSIELRELR